MKIKNWLKQYVWFFLFVFWLIFLIWFYFPIIKEKVDLDYLENLYSTSQWMMPLSKRIMSDNQLYQLAGYRLVNGAGLFTINGETPPLGKILYGEAIKYWSTPLYVSVAFIILILMGFYFLLVTLFGEKNKKLIWLAMFLLLISPLFFSQSIYTMLDLPQLFFLLLHALFIIKTLKTESVKKKTSYLIAAGFSLGLFAATKVPVFVPVILLVDFLAFYQKAPKLKFIEKMKFLVKDFMLLLASMAFAWILSYTIFFYQGGNLIGLAKAQKWVLSFYLNASHGKSILAPVMIFITSLSGFFESESGWTWMNDWNILWIGIVLSMFIFWKQKKWQNQQPENNYLYYLVTALFVFNMLTSFYPRYLLLILPFGILISLFSFKKIKKLFLTIIVIVLITQAGFFLYPTQKQTFNFVQEVWQNQNYHDLYFYLAQTNKPPFSWFEFQKRMKQIDQDLKVETITIVNNDSNFAWPWQNEIIQKVTIKRKMPMLITWENTVLTKWQRVRGKWSLVWQNDLVAPNFNFDKNLKTEIAMPREVGVWSKDKLIAKIIPQTVIWWNKELVNKKDENIILDNLTKIMDKGRASIENQIWVKGENLSLVEVGAIENVELVAENDYLSIATFSGILIKPSERATEILFYNKKFLSARDKIKNFDKSIIGGRVWLIDQKGEKTLLYEVEKNDQPDLDLTNLF